MFGLSILLLAGGCGAATVPADRGAAARPNLIVIMADDLGAPELASYGHATHRTPNLDRLAAEGVRFRTAYATPICTPSRVMLMTGRYGFHTGWYNFSGRPGAADYADPDYDLGTAEQTFADVLKSAGYATAVAGKWQLTGKVPTLVHDTGFDTYRIWAYTHNLPEGVRHTGGWENEARTKAARFWHPSLMQDGAYHPTRADEYGPDLFADFIIDFIDRHQDEPFFVYYPMALTHTPWDPTPALDDPAVKTEGGLKHNVEAMDRIVGRIVRALEERGLRENTLVVFTGDNGTEGGGKAEPTERGVRVPFIASMPGTVASGVVSDALVDLTDVLPTLADFAGADLPEGRAIDGVSLRPTLVDPDAPHRDWIFSYLHEDRILRDARWLLETEDGGRFYDTGGRRDGVGYRDVTGSRDPEVLAARRRFDAILQDLPAPEGLEPCPYLERHKARRAREAAAGT